MRFWFLSLLTLPLAAQPPSFEVASIRPANARITGSLCGNLKPSPESVLASAVWPLSAVIEDAYKNEVDDFDFPQWTRSGPFTVSVKIPPNTAVDACRQMLRNLLTERFQLATGVETREVNRYFLKLAKSGLKLKSVNGPPTGPQSDVEIDVKNGLATQTFHGASMVRVSRAIEANAILYSRARGLRLTGNVNSFRISGFVDETGLTGYYDGKFEFAVTASLHDEFDESLEDAVSRQLGLTLELRRAPGKVLVILSSEHTPSEN